MDRALGVTGQRHEGCNRKKQSRDEASCRDRRQTPQTVPMPHVSVPGWAGQTERPIRKEPNALESPNHLNWKRPLRSSASLNPHVLPSLFAGGRIPSLTLTSCKGGSPHTAGISPRLSSPGTLLPADIRDNDTISSPSSSSLGSHHNISLAALSSDSDSGGSSFLRGQGGPGTGSPESTWVPSLEVVKARLDLA